MSAAMVVVMRRAESKILPYITCRAHHQHDHRLPDGAPTPAPPRQTPRYRRRSTSARGLPRDAPTPAPLLYALATLVSASSAMEKITGIRTAQPRAMPPQRHFSRSDSRRFLQHRAHDQQGKQPTTTEGDARKPHLDTRFATSTNPWTARVARRRSFDPV